MSEKWDPGEYQEGGIRASTRKVGSGRVPENGPEEYWKGGIQESTGEGSERVPEMWDPGEYRKGS